MKKIYLVAAMSAGLMFGAMNAQATLTAEQCTALAGELDELEKKLAPKATAINKLLKKMAKDVADGAGKEARDVQSLNSMQAVYNKIFKEYEPKATKYYDDCTPGDQPGS